MGQGLAQASLHRDRLAGTAAPYLFDHYSNLAFMQRKEAAHT